MYIHVIFNHLKEVVGRGSKTQIQVCGNLMYLIQR